MEASMNVHMLEGQSTTRPPLFTGSNFAYWKARMRIYLRCIDLDILELIEKKYVEKPKVGTMTDGERHQANLNAKAMNALICGLSLNEYNRVSTCATTYKIRVKLCITHEGTPKLRNPILADLCMNMSYFKCFQMNQSMLCFLASLTLSMNCMVLTRN